MGNTLLTPGDLVERRTQEGMNVGGRGGAGCHANVQGRTGRGTESLQSGRGLHSGKQGKGTRSKSYDNSHAGTDILLREGEAEPNLGADFIGDVEVISSGSSHRNNFTAWHMDDSVFDTPVGVTNH